MWSTCREVGSTWSMRARISSRLPWTQKFWLLKSYISRAEARASSTTLVT